MTERHADGLLQMYLAFDLVEEAFDVALHIVSFQDPLPFALLDKLVAGRTHHPKYGRLLHLIRTKK